MRKFLIGMMIVGVTLTGCNKKEKEGGGGVSVDVSGYWVGKWTSTQSQDSGAIIVRISQDSQGEISGWLYVYWNDSIPVTGQISGYDIEFGYVGGDSTTYTGQVSQDGKHAEGSYTIRDSGVVDEGTWYVDRVQPNWGGTWDGTIIVLDIPPDTINVSDGKWDAAFVEYASNDTTILAGFIWIYYNSAQDTIANARPAFGGIVQDSIGFGTPVKVNSRKGYILFTGTYSNPNYSGTWAITPYPDMVTGSGNWTGGKK